MSNFGIDCMRAESRTDPCSTVQRASFPLAISRTFVLVSTASLSKSNPTTLAASARSAASECKPLPQPMSRNERPASDSTRSAFRMWHLLDSTRLSAKCCAIKSDQLRPKPNRSDSSRPFASVDGSAGAAVIMATQRTATRIDSFA